MTDDTGKVYLVGAGPGDPGLLTLRGKELLERARVVVYDSLVNDALLRHAPGAETIDVGKRPGKQPLTQDDINRVLIDQAREGGCIVRLKGGDPFIFGRGGEEASALVAAGIAFEIVPGVTAGVGAAAYAGIPLTQRGLTGHVTFVTGHANADFSALPKDGTLVIYMGVDALAANLDALIDAGHKRETPAAAIEWGTLPRQHTVTATLGKLAAHCDKSELHAPAVIVVGQVVTLRETLAWFEDRPLFGKRVVVTRTRRRAAELVRLLRDQGADVFEFPTVEIEASANLDPLGDLSRFDWIVLTSVNGVDTLFDRLSNEGQDARALHGTKLCAISAKTAEALNARSINVDAVPDQYESDVVVQHLEHVAGSLEGHAILMPRADIGRSTLPDALRSAGATVEELQAYRTVVPASTEALLKALGKFDPHYVTFGSAVSARNFHEILGSERTDALAKTARFAAIGPIAADAASDCGMSAAVVPEIHTVNELVETLVRFDSEIGSA